MKKIVIVTTLHFLMMVNYITAQSLDYALQPNAKTTVSAALAVEDGYLWVTNGINPDQKGLPVIQKWDEDGQILWEKTLDLNFSVWGQEVNYIEFLQIIAVGQHILISCNVFSDWGSIPQLILLDSYGNFLERRNFTPPYFSVFGAISPIFSDQLFPVVYSHDVNLLRLDSFDAVPVSLGIKANLTGIAKSGSDQILVGLWPVGVIKIDPLTGISLDTLHPDVYYVNSIYVTPENNILLAGFEELILLDDQYNIITTQQHNLERIIGGFFDGQTWFLNNKNGVHRFDASLQYIGELASPTSDAIFTRVLPGENHHWAIGNETFNAFRMPLQFDGTFDLPKMDVAMNWVKAEIVKISGKNQWQNVVTIKGIELSFQNMGPDTLYSVVLNWDLPQCKDDAPYYGNDSYQFRVLHDVVLAPGASTIIAQGFDTIYSNLSNACLAHFIDDFCFELSLPNQRLDANNENDRACTPVTYGPLTNTNDQANANAIQTFPNPFSSNITISGIPVHCASIDIYDGLGRSKQRITPTSETLTVDLSANGSGLNHLVFRRSDGIILRYETLIKE
jgi:hypothetical protein